jgi:hypothetical protein
MTVFLRFRPIIPAECVQTVINSSEVSSIFKPTYYNIKRYYCLSKGNPQMSLLPNSLIKECQQCLIKSGEILPVSGKK